MTYTDEHLSAFLDGQLAKSESRTLEAELEINIELAERLASLAEANEAVKLAYSEEIDTPIPEHILTLLAPNTSNATNDNDTDNVVELKPNRNKFNLSKWAAPLAASFAMMIGLTIGRGMSPTLNQDALFDQMSGVVAVDNPLYQVLETAPSATNISFGKKGDLEIKPILTFTSGDGNYCREFKTQTPKSAARGVACRQGEIWNVLMLNQTERSNDDGFRTASGSSNGAINQFIDDLLVGIPFDADAELKTIKNEWK